MGDLLRDAASADEATQETFVRAHRTLASLEDEGRLGAWLFGIARNVFRERLRARTRENRHSEFREEALDGAPALAAPSPRDLLLHRESSAVLQQALAQLGEDRRAALVLRLDHHLGYAEIGQVMEWSESKVKNEIHRARLELRERLKQYLRGES